MPKKGRYANNAPTWRNCQAAIVIAIDNQLSHSSKNRLEWATRLSRALTQNLVTTAMLIAVLQISVVGDPQLSRKPIKSLCFLSPLFWCSHRGSISRLCILQDNGEGLPCPFVLKIG